MSRVFCLVSKRALAAQLDIRLGHSKNNTSPWTHQIRRIFLGSIIEICLVHVVYSVEWDTFPGSYSVSFPGALWVGFLPSLRQWVFRLTSSIFHQTEPVNHDHLVAVSNLSSLEAINFRKIVKLLHHRFLRQMIIGIWPNFRILPCHITKSS